MLEIVRFEVRALGSSVSVAEGFRACVCPWGPAEPELPAVVETTTIIKEVGVG